MPVLCQGSERLCICVLMVSILSLSTIFLFDLGTLPTCYLLSFILLWIWDKYVLIIEVKTKTLLFGIHVLTIFFHFIRLFWYHVLTWTWDNPNVSASSMRSGVDKYLCDSNFFSSPISCSSVKTVLLLRHRFGLENPFKSDGDRERM
jgi:hypothetical protein